MHSAGACLDLVQRVNCPHLNEPRPCAPSFRICLSWDAWHIWHIYNDKTLLCLLNLRPVSWAGEGALVSAPVYNYKHYRTPFVKQHVSDPVPMRFRSGPDPHLSFKQKAAHLIRHSFFHHMTTCLTSLSYLKNPGPNISTERPVRIQTNTKHPLEHRLWHHYLDPEKPITFAGTL